MLELVDEANRLQEGLSKLKEGRHGLTAENKVVLTFNASTMLFSADEDENFPVNDSDWFHCRISTVGESSSGKRSGEYCSVWHSRKDGNR